MDIPASFEWNGGRARIETSPLEEKGISELDRGITRLQVKLVSLDDVFSQGERLSVVKLDLEGFELDALMGMKQMLRERRIRHIVFEDTGEYPAPTHHLLREVGYSVFRLDHGFFGIKCCCDKQPRVEPGLPNMRRHIKRMKQSDNWNVVDGNLLALVDIYFTEARTRTRIVGIFVLAPAPGSPRILRLAPSSWSELG